MSDYFNKDPKQSAGRSTGANPWQQDPFAAYDDPAYQPEAPDAAADPSAPDEAPYAPPLQTPDYSAWRRPASLGGAPQEPARPARGWDAADDASDDGDAAYGHPYEAPPQPEPDFGIVDADASRNPYGNGRPDFTAYAAQSMPAYGGVQPPRNDNFAAMGADAPTRIARPAARPQTVSKHVTVDAGDPFARAAASAAPAVPDEGAAQAAGAPRQRRAGRMARYENAPAAEPAAFTPPAERPRASFDPFSAGDSEAAPEEPPMEPAPEEAAPPRRAAVPGERYSGARTAMPHAEMAPRPEPMREATHENPSMEEPPRAPYAQGVADPYGAPAARGGMPPQGQRPPGRRGPDGRPIPPQRPQGMPPQGQRPPVRLGPDGRPIPPQQRPQGMPPQGQRPQGMPPQRPAQADPYAAEGFDPRGRGRVEDNARFDPRRNYPGEPPRASVERPRYDFEEEPEEDERPRRGGVFLPLVVVLLVIGGLLAGIVLPDWDAMGGGLGTAMGKIKSAVTGVLGSVKDLISPEEAGVKSFTVSPTSATAPVELVFSVQASASVTDIRIVDQTGAEVLSKTLTDSDMLGGEVTKNSKYNIWTLRYACDNAYSGIFTAQPMLKDGTWGAGLALVQPVSIAPPAVIEPPVQDFTVDTAEGAVPLTLGFTVVTSLDVSAVQIVDDYGSSVAESYLSDAGSQVLETDTTRTWSLTAPISDAYTGSYYAAYETDADLSFIQSDYSLDVALTAGGPEPSPAAAADAQSSLSDDAAYAPPTDTQAAKPTVAAPTQTPEPAATETPKPAATPAPTALPLLDVTADSAAAPSALKLTSTAYEELKQKDGYERTAKIVVNDPFNYVGWDQSGVLTFRENPFRQNAAYGTVEIEKSTLTEMWKVAIEGSVKAKSATLTGVGWPGQPLIVKWPTQLRSLLGIKDDSKAKTALKEAIVGAQNGKIYFLDLVTGEATRDPIANEWPSNGALSLDTNAVPMLAVGQHIAVLAKKTVDNGLHLYNLLNNKELTLLKGKEKLMRSNYSGFSGAPLFDKNTGTMIAGGENGLLYTMEPNADFDYILGTLKIKPAYQRYSWLANKQKAKSTNVDGSVAMYANYVYFGDQSGIVQCVDVNTLSPVWAVDTGDNVDATVALDMENETTLSLYTANTLMNQGRSGVCTVRKLDALSGKELWAYQVPDLVYTTEFEIGCYASPVVGQNAVKDLVFFTATNGSKGSTLFALDKATGSLKWSFPMTSASVSSPVAVYNAAGDAWLVQAESAGKLHLLEAKTGAERTSLQLEGNVEGSPAVYRDVLVIGTTGANSNIYGIKLE
ncbi:MAG: hypothetical protein VB104_12120 [Candidatus Limiplasma sp.]|nr:hypothetical protein [Candidatus Limiplasma sp.]